MHTLSKNNDAGFSSLGCFREKNFWINPLLQTIEGCVTDLDGEARLTIQHQSFAKGGDNLFLLGWSDAGEKWERESAGSDGFGNREMQGRGNAVAPCGLLVDGCEISRSGDPVLSEKRLDAGAVGGLGEADDEDEPADGPIGQGERGQLKGGDADQERVVALGSGATEVENLADAAELNTAQGAGDIGQTVVEADIGVMKPLECGRWSVQQCRARISAFHPIDKDLSLGAPPLIAKAAEAITVELRVRQDGAAFAGGELLVGVEAEDGEVAEGADAALMKFSTDRFAGVFNDDKVVARGKGAEGEHVGGNTEGMNDQDGTRSRGEESFDCGGDQVEGYGIDVGEDGCSADVEDGVGDGDEGE